MSRERTDRMLAALERYVEGLIERYCKEDMHEPLKATTCVRFEAFKNELTKERCEA